MLSVNNIYKNYGTHQALSGVSLSIERGQVVALLAPNGAGKSTLVSIIAGLLKADHGQVTIDGLQRHQRKHYRKIQSNIGVAGQETGLYPSLTVKQNLQFFASIYSVPRQHRQRRIHETAALLGLEGLLNRQANALSGGESRRLHTACAIIHRPPLLLLDEPTVGADPEARNDILHAVKQLATEGSAVLYTSHYLPEIETLAADIVVMDNGKILEKGQQPELIDCWGDQMITIEFNQPIAYAMQKRVKGSYCLNPTQITIGQQGQAPTALSDILHVLQDKSDHILGIQQQKPTLEQVFLNIIKANRSSREMMIEKTRESV